MTTTILQNKEILSGVYLKRIPAKSGNMIIEATARTPFVKYSANKRALQLKGYSIEMDMHHFYNPIISHVKKDLEKNRELNVYMDLEDLNTSTAKILFNLFSFLSQQKEAGSQITIFWKANTPEMAETAMDFAVFTGLNFEIRTLHMAA